MKEPWVSAPVQPAPLKALLKITQKCYRRHDNSGFYPPNSQAHSPQMHLFFIYFHRTTALSVAVVLWKYHYRAF